MEKKYSKWWEEHRGSEAFKRMVRKLKKQGMTQDDIWGLIFTIVPKPEEPQIEHVGYTAEQCGREK